jgi:hypothetical protein
LWLFIYKFIALYSDSKLQEEWFKSKYLLKGEKGEREREREEGSEGGGKAH